MNAGMLLGGLVQLGGLLLSLASLIVLIFCWKRRLLRWLFACGFLLGLLPLAADLLDEPNDNWIAHSWIGSYTLPCSAGGRLVLSSDSQFELSMPDRGISEVGDWEYIFDDDDFIYLKAESGRKIRLRVKGENPGFEFPIGRSGYDPLRCILVREQ